VIYQLVGHEKGRRGTDIPLYHPYLLKREVERGRKGRGESRKGDVAWRTRLSSYLICTLRVKASKRKERGGERGRKKKNRFLSVSFNFTVVRKGRKEENFRR